MAKKKEAGDKIIVKHRDHKGEPTERVFSRPSASFPKKSTARISLSSRKDAE
jgi:hypothetical protein